MTGPRRALPLFGDQLARARLAWVRQMGDGLAQLGYEDYRRSDALVFRCLLADPTPIGKLGRQLGVTRQAARKVVDGLGERGYARTERDVDDARRINVVLTPLGQRYARAVVEVIDGLNGELARRVEPEQLAAALAVLATVIAGIGSHSDIF